MPGESGGPSGGDRRFRSSVGDMGPAVEPGELSVHASLLGKREEAPPLAEAFTGTSRVRFGGEAPEEAAVAPEAAEDALAEVLSAPHYQVAERDGRIYARSGATEVDVTDMFGAREPLDRMVPVNPDDLRSPRILKERAEITTLARTHSGSRAGMLRVHVRRPNGVQIGMDVEEVGRPDREGRAWMLPVPDHDHK